MVDEISVFNFCSINKDEKQKQFGMKIYDPIYGYTRHKTCLPFTCIKSLSMTLTRRRMIIINKLIYKDLSDG